MSDSIIDWPNKCCAKCRKPLVYEAQPAHYASRPMTNCGRLMMPYELLSMDEFNELLHWLMEQSAIAARASAGSPYQEGREDAFDSVIHRLEKILNARPSLSANEGQS